jgi:ubiquinone/menaquinone biosynthesis C-methylase UbiE
MSDTLFRGFTPEIMEARCRGRMLERRVGIVTDFLSAQPGLGRSPVLEIGAGTGQTMSLVASAFPGVQFTAVEPVREYVRHARQKYASVNPRLDYQDGAAEVIGLSDNSVDVAYSVNIWHHVGIARLRDAAISVSRVLKKGAAYLAMEPNFYHPYVSACQAWTREERCFLPWRELIVLEEFFTVEKKTYCIAFPEWVRSVPPWVVRVEEVLERCPLFAGSVVYTLKKR